ncbi:MAG: hypothetical protein QOD97_4822, partial [Mycobacterium sp.]|nr:hypothetical protein [Mycobacterium sp.]
MLVDGQPAAGVVDDDRQHVPRAVRGWRRPATLAPTGLVIWLSTVVIGMLLRKATSQGTAVSFV